MSSIILIISFITMICICISSIISVIIVVYTQILKNKKKQISIEQDDSTTEQGYVPSLVTHKITPNKPKGPDEDEIRMKASTKAILDSKTLIPIKSHSGTYWYCLDDNFDKLKENPTIRLDNDHSGAHAVLICNQTKPNCGNKCIAASSNDNRMAYLQKYEKYLMKQKCEQINDDCKVSIENVNWNDLIDVTGNHVGLNYHFGLD